MSDAGLAATMLCCAFGIAAARATKRSAWAACACCAAIMIATAFLPIPEAAARAAAWACWIGTIANAACVHMRAAPRPARAWIAGVLTGIAAGAVFATTRAPTTLFVATAALFATLALARAVQSRLPIAAKIVASWLIAAGLLAAAVHAVPTTPGDQPDHLD